MRFMIFSIAFLVAVAGFTQRANADGCRVVGQRSYSAPYQQASYPTVSYAQNYTPTIAIPIETRTFFQVAPELAQVKINQAIADEAAEKATNKLMNKLIEEQRKLQSSPRPTTEIPAPAVSNEPGDPLASLPISYGTGERLDNHAPHSTSRAIFAAHCTACHGKESKTLNLTQPELLTPDQWDSIINAVNHEENYKSMPPKKAKLPLSERQTIRKDAYQSGSNRLQ